MSRHYYADTAGDRCVLIVVSRQMWTLAPWLRRLAELRSGVEPVVFNNACAASIFAMEADDGPHPDLLGIVLDRTGLLSAAEDKFIWPDVPMLWVGTRGPHTPEQLEENDRALDCIGCPVEYAADWHPAAVVGYSVGWWAARSRAAP